MNKDNFEKKNQLSFGKEDFLKDVVDFKGLKISLASPETILSWSYGEVTKPETINYRTLKPEKDGLFCERIFGPTKDWECYCGKYKRIRYRGIICDKCGVEITQSRVRRERMGHITLACPVAHVWFFRGSPSKLSLLLDLPSRSIENVIYFVAYLVLKVDEDGKKRALEKLEEDKILDEKKLKQNFERQEKEINEVLEKEIKEVKEKIKNKEQQELTIAEIRLKAKQRLLDLEGNYNSEKEKTERFYQEFKNSIQNLKKFALISEDELSSLKEHGIADFLEVGIGAEALLKAIEELDINKLITELRNEVQKTTGQRHLKAAKRLRFIGGMKKAGISPSWMILKVLPVLPPDLRPMVQLNGGRFATSDLNDLYRRIINRNNRLKHLIELGAPEIILRNEKRMLQEAVDSLIDIPQRIGRRTVQPLRSLSEMLRGKQGRFRQNLLGKRVDYSGRSVIIVGPELSLNQCGLPKEMAIEIFKPFVLRELITRGLAPNVKSAKNILERRQPEVFDILEEITKNHPVLLNRAPTLHKLGIQAFYPVLIEGSAIRIHPCVCAGYNADFDGDQMAVHLPLSSYACKEAEELMLPINNLLKPADGSPITIPTKEMALGCYWLTLIRDEVIPEENLKIFSGEDEAIFAYQSKKITLHQAIKVKIDGKIIKTSVGRVLFNEILPKDLRFINETINLAKIKSLIDQALRFYSPTEVAHLVDDLKDLGFWAATKGGGNSFSIFDCEIIPQKKEMIKEAEEKINEIEKNFLEGLITQEEKKRLSNEVWLEVTEQIANKTWDALGKNNPVRIIIESGGARASKDQLRQLAAMRGLVVDPLGKIVEMPTKSNFREGLSIFEYVTSTRGSRKGLTDSALKTADAGYLTRRLIDVAHNMIVRIEDCGTKEGIEISKNDKRQTPFSSRILGRVLASKVVDPKNKKKVLLEENKEITESDVEILEKYGVESVIVRSPLTCQAPYGLCAACYGRDLGTAKRVEVGTPVGIIAAQSIGEPGTQLTMRIRHTGGIVGLDVTQGLPRVEELFEVRTPKSLSPISEISGKVQIEETTEGYKIKVKSRGKPVEEREYFVPLSSELKVKEGENIFAGQQLASGFLDIKEVLATRGLRGAQKYLLEEIQAVYESQGISINDKHFEVIIRKMSDKVKIISPGDTPFLVGELVDKLSFEEENKRVLAEGGEPAAAEVIILGITRAALYTESWLSAASFQETTNVLTDAACLGKEDKLVGLKENVIIGRLIPTSPERAKIEI